jgi:saccharopine dehydrogenase-like NADP-dependent oxidoreductase
MPRDGINEEMKTAFENCTILLDCSPGSQAPRMAQFAKDYKMHYANLTEYVAETDAVIKIAETAETGFVVQTGLAPGFINVLAMSLYNEFVEKHQNEKVERIGMKVGALSTHAHAPHFYGFTWSPIGVATEYVKTARVVRDYQRVQLPALSERERIFINGFVYEADLTSGGAANLPKHFEGKAKNLDYKTLRHVGHYKWVEGLVKHLPFDEKLPQNLEDQMLEKIPSVEDDFVIVHSSVDGFDAQGRRRMVEKAFYIKPLEINGHFLRAIQTTTAVPLIQCADMLASNKYKGVIMQTDIDPKAFLNGNFVSRVYKN